MSFYDLSIRARSARERDRQVLLKRSYELGYSAIIWSVNHFGHLSLSVQVDLKSNNSLNIDLLQGREAEQLRSFVDFNIKRKANVDSYARIKQLSRITITADDTTQAQTITSGNEILRAFDIVAVCPGTSQVFSFVCKQADVDLICLDFTHKFNYPLNKKLLDIAVKRGINFEILYSPLITSPASRRMILATCRTLIKYLHGKHIVLSSGAETMSQLRGPMDVVNMGEVLGLTKEQAIQAISENCANVLRHALARRLRFLPLEVLSTEAFTSRWPEVLLGNGGTGQLLVAEEGLVGVAADESKEEESDEDADMIFSSINKLPASVVETEGLSGLSKRPREAAGEDVGSERRLRGRTSSDIGNFPEVSMSISTSNIGAQDLFSEDFIALNAVVNECEADMAVDSLDQEDTAESTVMRQRKTSDSSGNSSRLVVTESRYQTTKKKVTQKNQFKRSGLRKKS